MAFIILGKTSDDKGSQLEQLTKTLLAHQGYSNIATNVQVGGGSELDVTASRKNTTGVKEIITPVLCECKAHQSPITLPDWLKFIGKLTIARKKNNRTIGLMLALSGANGNVIGSYSQDFDNDDSVQLIANDDLMNLLMEVFDLPTVDSIKESLSTVPGIKVEDVDLVYYKKKSYWLVSLGEQRFTLCNAKGDLAKRNDVQEIIPLLKGTTQYEDNGYVDIFEGFELQRRKKLLKIIIVTELACGRRASAKEVGAIAKEFSVGNIDINELLTDDPFLTYDKSKKTISLKPDNQIDFCDFYRFVLSDNTPVDLVMSDFYQSHIDENLLDKIWEIQYSFSLDDEDKQSCLYLLRLSPSALLYALTPDMMFHGYQIIKVDEQMRTLYQSHFKSNLFKFFQNDFHNQNLYKLFLTKGADKAIVQSQLTVAGTKMRFSLEAKQNFMLIAQKEADQAILVVAKDNV